MSLPRFYGSTIRCAEICAFVTPFSVSAGEIDEKSINGRIKTNYIEGKRLRYDEKKHQQRAETDFLDRHSLSLLALVLIAIIGERLRDEEGKEWRTRHLES